MSLISLYFIKAATYTATVYGYGEYFCGDKHAPRPCDSSAITATGDRFKPHIPSVAVHMPDNMRLRRGHFVCFYGVDGQRHWLPVLDKKGNTGFDLTPAAVRLLGYTPTPYWSGKLTLCSNL